MTPVEKLEAALARLEELRDGSAPGPWAALRVEKDLGWFVESPAHGIILTTGYVGNNDSRPHAELIVTLHRTIDAQLAILRTAMNWIEEFAAEGYEYADGRPMPAGRVYKQSPEGAAVFALADAILGGA